jgi:hypothetical protein
MILLHFLLHARVILTFTVAEFFVYFMEKQCIKGHLYAGWLRQVDASVPERIFCKSFPTLDQRQVESLESWREKQSSDPELFGC